jgi:hypothetical protein
MKEPTDRTLIDAMALRMRQMIDPVDLEKNPAFRQRWEEAGRVVIDYVATREKVLDSISGAPPSIDVTPLPFTPPDWRPPDRITRIDDVDSPELTDDQLSRLRPARGPGESREGTLESVIDVRNDNGSAIHVSFTNGRGEAWFKLVEIEGDPRHGLTEEQWAFKETLREAFTAGQSMTFEFDGRKFTGVRIAAFTTEA